MTHSTLTTAADAVTSETSTDLQSHLSDYAHLLLTTGVALTKGQTLVISVDVEHHAFAALVTKRAYELGAKDVVLNWRSRVAAKERLLHADESVLATPAAWIPVYYREYVDASAAFLSLISADPTALEGIDAKRISLQSRALNKSISFYHDAIMGSAVTWCVASVASERWADALGYNGSTDEKIARLWRTIFKLCRMTDVAEDETFDKHLARLKDRTTRLNALALRSLHYRCPNGTDLTVRLPAHHIWQGGSERAQNGVTFTANIPTEEVFSAPQYNGVDGIVFNTKPLIYQGNRIDGFYIRFKDGAVVEFHADEGEAHLRELIETDEGSHFLGEVALVDHESPISASGEIFFETLYDENASCHFALGAAYPICLENGESMSEAERTSAGLNSSLAHTDFMIGCADMDIDGITESGESVAIMRRGRLLV